MHGVPEHPSPQTRTAVTARITTHVRRGWPHLGKPDVTHRGQFCYVAARLPGHRQPHPILRLRYQGSADRWAIGTTSPAASATPRPNYPRPSAPRPVPPNRGSTTPSSSTPAPAASPDTDATGQNRETREPHETP